MARKMKGKASRKARGLKHSKRVKAKQVKAAPKKSKPSNRKRAELRAKGREVAASIEQPSPIEVVLDPMESDSDIDVFLN